MDWACIRVMVLKAIILIVSITSLAIFVALIKQVVEIEFDSTRSGTTSSRIPSESNDPIKIGGDTRHLMWFIQISDIHLSVNHDPARKSDLFTFCTQVVDAIKPSVVVLTGDITDSRTREPFGSHQYEEEWIWYQEVLNRSKVLNKTVWLDVRGNHDAFDVYSKDSINNFYRKYSPLGKHSHSHYKYELKVDTETYSFIGIDSCPSPSPKRPFNFIGFLKDSDIKVLKQMKEDAVRSSNTTIWFGHYPTSSIARPRNADLRVLLDGPYLCGHYHTILGFINHMYATHASGGLEAEVGDWKDNRIFRIAAIDHGLFSFQDIKLHQWPIILITNPKPALFSMPHLEPVHRLKTSSHVRVLVFSPHRISSVNVKVGDGPWSEMNASSANLFTHDWNPLDYSKGLHTIMVKATDEDDNERVVKQEFSIDGSRPDFSFKAKFSIRLSVQSFFRSICFAVVTIAVSPLLILRMLHHLNKGKLLKMRARSSRICTLIFKFYLLAITNTTFTPLVAVPLYAVTGPWFVGKVLNDHWGVGFIWGMYVGRSYIPLGFPYFFATLSLLLFHIPITACLAHIVHCCYNSRSDVATPVWKKVLHIRHFCFLFIAACSLFYATLYKSAYGLACVIFGFYNTWCVIVYVLVWLYTFKLGPKSFKISGLSIGSEEQQALTPKRVPKEE